MNQRTINTLLFSVLIILFMATGCQILSAKEKKVSLVDAIKLVESGPGDQSKAIGDSGKAIGPLQIHRAYFIDAKQYDKSLRKYKYEDVKDFEIAKKVFYAYMKRYATKKRLGREPTDEDISRIHNGGLNGYKKKSTKKYWRKVKAKLK